MSRTGENSFSDFIQPKTLEKHLRNGYGLNAKEIKDKLSLFGLESDWKVKNLGFAHQKVFPIICEFQKSNIVYFDYIGLAPDSEEQLTAYVKTELAKGKSAISFDNLYYKSGNPDLDRICNLDIKQRRISLPNNTSKRPSRPTATAAG